MKRRHTIIREGFPVMKVNEMASPSSSHVVIFPFMAHGHTNPALDLAKALSLRKLKVSIVTTPSNAEYIARKTSSFPTIRIITIPFPSIIGLPNGWENTAELPSVESYLLPFLMATKQLQVPFEQLLQTMKDSGDLPLCVISDFFLGWTLEVCQIFGVPRLVFHGMGVFSMALCKVISIHTPHLKITNNSDPLDLPGIELPFTLTISDVPGALNLPNYDDPFSRFTMEAAEADGNSWGNIVNSFVEMEGEYVASLQSFYKEGAQIWCLGPLFLYDRSFEETKEVNHYSDHLDQWLDDHARDGPGTVIYASFGTQSDVSDTQLDEVALGLEDSGYPFLLVVRSATWTLPRQIEEKVIKSKGLISKEFVDQRRILFHRATGGFLSHCGWNSVMESACAAVPILAMPITAEQLLNAKLVVDGLGVAVRIEKANGLSNGVAVSKEDISKGARELMAGEGGRRARESARTLSRLGRGAVEEEGSSRASLDRLIQHLLST